MVDISYVMLTDLFGTGRQLARTVFYGGCGQSRKFDIQVYIPSGLRGTRVGKVFDSIQILARLVIF